MKHVATYNLTFLTTGLVTVFLLTVLSSNYLNAVDYATTARGVDVYLVTNTQAIQLEETFTADIFITNDQTPLNAMEAEVLFDPALFTVNSFTFGESLCEDRFVLDTVIDNVTGRLHMSCGTITPFTGNATVFGTITFTSRTPGISALTFGEKTHVHVHDGLGTEIARDTYPTTIVVETGV